MKKGSVQVRRDHRTEPRCFRENGSVVFCGYYTVEKNCGIVFYKEEGGAPISVRFPEDCGIGRLYSVRIDGIPEDYSRYRLLEGKREVPDPFAFRVFGLSSFDAEAAPEQIFGEVMPAAPIERLARTFSGRLKERTAPEDDLLYLLHVRGFTMSPSAGVPRKHRGTYAGVIDKLDHIASLGVTAVELMPCYELIAREEIEQEYGKASALYGTSEKRVRINYWGFKKGYYFAPRSAYAAGSDPCAEFHAMADALHDRHIALILQFWFPQDYPASLLSVVLRHWVRFYGVDGFHLIGGGIPVETVAADPALSSVKIYYESLDPQKLARTGTAAGGRRMVSLYNGEFCSAVRRFIKSDDHSLGSFFGVMIRNHADYGVVNYLANYSGMRLIDSVSYEHKHNEANEENNIDGEEDMITWNCGVEGPTRKQAILRLRRRQLFNALVMLFFAQGTPMLCAGDEFLHTQEGNNNPYCQDNAVSWINWRGETQVMGEAVLSFVRFLSAYRRQHPILRQPVPFKLMDYKAYGYPDLSAHGQDAWQPDFSGFSHSIGMLYCGLYAKEQNPAFLFCVFNCHWESRRFALPAMPRPLSWTAVIDTSRMGHECEEHSLSDEKSVLLAGRSCMVLEARGRFPMNAGEGRTPF